MRKFFEAQPSSCGEATIRTQLPVPVADPCPSTAPRSATTTVPSGIVRRKDASLDGPVRRLRDEVVMTTAGVRALSGRAPRGVGSAVPRR